MENLYVSNTPERFWRLEDQFSAAEWDVAFQQSLPVLDFVKGCPDLDAVLRLTLGEERFGKRHWQLTPFKQFYYLIKPFVPRPVTILSRKMYNHRPHKDNLLRWPVEPRYVEFLWQILKRLLQITGKNQIRYKRFWPDQMPFSFVLTHDVEMEEGQRFVPVIADLEESLGFRSAFYFVSEGYAHDWPLIHDLRARGFEIGLHGLHHDEKLFLQTRNFPENAARLNQNLQRWDARGFRSPLTIRNPYLLQDLNIEYDLSFFDSDPYEPIPGGTMSIWPFFMGKFLELPFTLPQDFTLYYLCGEKSPAIWLDKVKFIRQHHGMALLITHPDYLMQNPTIFEMYRNFLLAVKDQFQYWNALPKEVASWWKNRMSASPSGQESLPDGMIFLDGEQIRVD